MKYSFSLQTARKAFIYKKRSKDLRNTLYAIITFSVLLMIAISYQLHLNNLATDINVISNKTIQAIENKDYEKAETLLSQIENKWNKNYKILMGFQDHSSVNSASIFLHLALNNYNTKEYSQVADNLINFTSILNELASENIPYAENIL